MKNLFFGLLMLSGGSLLGMEGPETPPFLGLGISQDGKVIILLKTESYRRWFERNTVPVPVCEYVITKMKEYNDNQMRYRW
jgi:hypothetical protein